MKRMRTVYDDDGSDADSLVDLEEFDEGNLWISVILDFHET